MNADTVFLLIMSKLQGFDRPETSVVKIKINKKFPLSDSQYISEARSHVCAPLNWWGQKKRVGEEIRRINSGLLPPTPRLTFPDAPIGGDLRALLENPENRHTALNWRERSNGQKPPGLCYPDDCLNSVAHLLWRYHAFAVTPNQPLLVLLWFGLSPFPLPSMTAWAGGFLTEDNNFVY